MTHKDLDRAEAWFARRGEPVVLFGRFIPLLRSFVSFAAGLGEMALPKFAIFTVIGCAVWCTALCSLGYSLAGSYNHVLKAFSFAGYVLGALAVIAVAWCSGTGCVRSGASANWAGPTRRSEGPGTATREDPPGCVPRGPIRARPGQKVVEVTFWRCYLPSPRVPGGGGSMGSVRRALRSFRRRNVSGRIDQARPRASWRRRST